MNSDQSDDESTSEAFVDAEENFDDNGDGNEGGKKSHMTSTPHSIAVPSSSPAEFPSAHESNNVHSDSTPPSKSPPVAIPEISVTDMSENKNVREVKSRGIVESDFSSPNDPEDKAKSTDNLEGTRVEDESSVINYQSNNIIQFLIDPGVEDEPVDITVYVKDLDTGKKIPASDLEEEIRKSNGGIDPLSFAIMRRNSDIHDDKSHSDEDERSNRNPKSLLKRLKKRSSRHEKEEDDGEGDEPGVTGNNAPVFSENLGGHESAQPHYIKTRTRHKKVKEFDKLFLAQELNNPISNEHGEANLDNSAIWTMKFSKDGKFLATGGQDTVVRVWAVISSDEEREHFLEGNGTSVYEMTSGAKLRAPDDRFFLSGSLDCKLRLWNIPDKRVAHWNETADQHLITAVGFTLDGKMAVAGSFSGLCQFYETVGLKYNTQIHVRSEFEGSVDSGLQIMGASSFSFISDDGRYIISGSEDRHIYIFRTDQSSMNSGHGATGNSWLKKEKCSFESFEAHGATVTVSIFAPTRTKQLIGLCGDPIFAKTINHDTSISPDKQTYPDDVSVNENDDDAEQFQCECGSTEFKAFISKGKSKLVCTNCHKAV
ncbi:12559_t:CDS:2 [Acaulospora colombiana]|uniref:12559_t:CDS:1 n=1 Tax=Acaulospora colombiana TaxID=27376 RepID=A0ACA9K2F4_9GLOM|nr:12559_t:CDS:2 [Acaulospora colombiana]